MAEKDPGIHLSWPMVGVMVALIVSTVTGAIQLGSVQTHVLINTARVDLLESREHERIADIARLKARQEMNEGRLDTMEKTRPTAETLNAFSKNAETRLDRLEERVRALEGKSYAPR